MGLPAVQGLNSIESQQTFQQSFYSTVGHPVVLETLLRILLKNMLRFNWIEPPERTHFPLLANRPLHWKSSRITVVQELFRPSALIPTPTASGRTGGLDTISKFLNRRAAALISLPYRARCAAPPAERCHAQICQCNARWNGRPGGQFNWISTELSTNFSMDFSTKFLGCCGTPCRTIKTRLKSLLKFHWIDPLLGRPRPGDNLSYYSLMDWWRGHAAFMSAERRAADREKYAQSQLQSMTSQLLGSKRKKINKNLERFWYHGIFSWQFVHHLVANYKSYLYVCQRYGYPDINFLATLK